MRGVGGVRRTGRDGNPSAAAEEPVRLASNPAGGSRKMDGRVSAEAKAQRHDHDVSSPANTFSSVKREREIIKKKLTHCPLPYFPCNYAFLWEIWWF